MANNILIEKQLSTVIYDQVRLSEYDQKNFGDYIDLVLVDKYKKNKEFLLKDNMFNLIVSIVKRENDFPSDFVDFLKSKLKETGILDYVDSLIVSDTSKLYQLYDSNKIKDINRELAKYYGTGQTLDIDIAIDLLFRHFDDETFNLDETSIKVILESLCYDKLDYLGIDEHICFFCDKDTVSERLYGEYNDGNKTVLMNDINIDKLVNFDSESITDKTFSAIETVFHECEHANQFIGEHNLSFLNMIIAKDVVLKWYGPEWYYDANYREISFEILARRKEVTETFKFLSYYNPLLSDKYYDLMMKQLKEENELLQDTRDPNHKFNDGDSNFKYLDEFVSETIKKRPDVLEIYPILGYEFNTDGSKKSLTEIFNSIKGLDKNQELYEYTFSLFNNVNPKNDKEYYDYLEELSNLDIEDETIIKQVSYVLIRLINEFDYLINNLNETSLNRLREIFNNLYKFTTIDNKFTNRLKSTIDERLNRLNSLDLSTKEL